MAIRTPMGGFFSCTEEDCRTREELGVRLGESGARVETLDGARVVLAAWTEFPGQGIWVGEGGAAAYDLDLINGGELRRLAGCDESASPGEVLWRLYRESGPAFLDRLRGAFGFALWDGGTHRLLVATDPFGVRPVVHGMWGTGSAAATRTRHLLLHPSLPTEVLDEAVHGYLFFSAIPSPLTVYRAVRKLEPGHYLSDLGRGVGPRTYYDLEYRPDEGAGEGYWRRAIPLHVRGAVGRLVPLSPPERTGCFLSGGTDSSSVVGYYTGLAGRPARTFSIGFDEPGYNELDYAHFAVERFGAEQHEDFVTPEDVLSLVEALPEIYDEPFGNSSVVPAYYCARLAREAGVEVLLGGDGGDEIFGGNERYVKDRVFQRYEALPRFLRAGLLEPLLRGLPGVGPLHKAKRYVRRANIPNPERFFSYNLLAETDPAQVFQREFLHDVDTGRFLEIARAHYRRAAPAATTDRLLYLDMKFTITDNDLRKVTEMGEAAGVRVRYPFLDRELVDFTATIPPALKVRPGRGRYIFKEAMRGFLPDEIITKTKHGFGLPIAPWFKKDPHLSALLHDHLFAPDARIHRYVRPEFLQTMRRGFEDVSTAYYGDNFWVFLMLEMWLRRQAR